MGQDYSRLVANDEKALCYLSLISGSHQPLCKAGSIQGIWISVPCFEANKWYVFADLFRAFFDGFTSSHQSLFLWSCPEVQALPSPRQTWLWSSEFPFGGSQCVCLGHYRCSEIGHCNNTGPIRAACLENSWKNGLGSWWNLPFCLYSEIKCVILKQNGAILTSLMGKIIGKKSVTLLEYIGILMAARSLYGGH